jgi:hypothetical protein
LRQRNQHGRDQPGSEGKEDGSALLLIHGLSEPCHWDLLIPPVLLVLDSIADVTTSPEITRMLTSRVLVCDPWEVILPAGRAEYRVGIIRATRDEEPADLDRLRRPRRNELLQNDE